MKWHFYREGKWEAVDRAACDCGKRGGRCALFCGDRQTVLWECDYQRLIYRFAVAVRAVCIIGDSTDQAKQVEYPS
jgi:hypothetical protein